jgi:methionine synthase II (cobalamin-independent)
VLTAYESALIREVEIIANSIPHDELAVQWDVASAVFERLERGEPTAYGRTRDEMMRTFVERHVRLGMGVPRDVHLIYHLCYGDANHKHSIEPASAALLVEFANQLSQEIGRTIELIHMPVPRGRSDEAYFAPLEKLSLQPETKLALGLVHHTDGVEGTRKRIAAARKYVHDDFAIATECGFGRRPVATLEKLIQIHAEVAGLSL